ncbi:MAG: hypothetical protein JOZ55_00515 [Alphaproteobacteria bacterium]|nr:hypothetical protein [Alphaproteobacteria bacterium]
MPKLEAVPVQPGGAEIFGRALAEFGRDIPELVLLDAGIGECCDLDPLRARQPQKVVPVSDASTGSVALALGLAAVGFKAWICCPETQRSTFSPGPFEGFSEIADLKLISFSVGSDTVPHFGELAHGEERIVLAPADCEESIRAMRALLDIKGLVCLQAQAPLVPEEADSTPFLVGRSQIVREGGDVTIIAGAPVIPQALDAAEELEAEGISVRVVRLATVLPVDREQVLLSASATGALVIAGLPLGTEGAISKAVASGIPCPIEFVSDFCDRSADLPNGVRTDGVLVEAAKRALARKVRRKPLR